MSIGVLLTDSITTALVAGVGVTAPSTELSDVRVVTNTRLSSAVWDAVTVMKEDVTHLKQDAGHFYTNCLTTTKDLLPHCIRIVVHIVLELWYPLQKSCDKLGYGTSSIFYQTCRNDSIQKSFALSRSNERWRSLEKWELLISLSTT